MNEPRPIGLRAEHKRDVIFRVEARGSLGELRTRADVQMLQPPENEVYTILSDEGAHRGSTGEYPNALALFSSAIAH